jgi:pSer/pThr/pTyr-binding forkhead associated (FHA) protein
MFDFSRNENDTFYGTEWVVINNNALHIKSTNATFMHLKKIHSLSLNKSIPRIHACQTVLSLTNFIEKNNNIYIIKLASYKNIFYGISNDINLMS